MKKRVQTARWCIAVLVGGALVTAACGSDNSEGSSAATTAATGSATTAAGGAATTAGSAATTAGTPASGEPLTIGLMNLESAAADYTIFRTGAEAAVPYINAHGGVNGRPIKFDLCKTDLTPESTIFCANKFVDADVPVVVDLIDFNDDSALEILSGANIPRIKFNSIGAKSSQAVGEVFMMLTAASETIVSDLVMAKELGAKKVVELVIDLPIWVDLFDRYAVQNADELGIEIETVNYPPQAADWTAIAATIMSHNPDYVTNPSAGDADCLGFIPAMRAAGYSGPIGGGSCEASFKEMNPDVAKDVIRPVNVWPQSLIDSAPAEVKADLEVMKANMGADILEDGWARIGFQIAMEAASLLRQVSGDLTAANIKASLPKASGPKFAARTPYNCDGTAWPGYSVCVTDLDYVRTDASGQLKVITEDPLRVPDELRPTAS